MEDSNSAVNATGEANVTSPVTSEIQHSEPESATGIKKSGNNSVNTSGETTSLPEGSSGDEQDSERKPVPYERFDDINKRFRTSEEERAKLEARVAEQERFMQVMKEHPEVASRFAEALGAEAPNPELQAADSTLQEMGYIKKTDVEKFVRDTMTQEWSDKELIDTARKLTQEIDGRDGRPRFDPVDIGRFMDEQFADGNLIRDPKMAYELKYKEELAEWRAKKAQQKAAGVYSERSGQTTTPSSGDGFEDAFKKGLETGNFMDAIRSKVKIPGT